MQRSYIHELQQKIGTNVLLKGWVHEIRDQSKVKFLLLRDRTGIVQVVITPSASFFEELASLSRESVVTINGTVKPANVLSTEVTEHTVEVAGETLTILSESAKDLPIQVAKTKEAATLSVRLDNRWIDLRKPRNLLTFKTWTLMEHAMREFWSKEGFIQIYSPKIMGAPSESGAELFSMEYFGKTAYLAQSPQFYKQMAMAAGFEKVFEIGPVFRANPSHTTRHDTEFTSIDVEMSFIDSHEDVMKFEEEWLAHTIRRIKEAYGEELEESFEITIQVPTTPFPRMTLNEAHSLLREKGRTPQGDLDAEDERVLSEIIKEKYNHEFVFVTEYPITVRPFYHMRTGEENQYTKSFDLIWKGVEITTGAQREHHHDILKEQALEKGLNLEPIKDYLNFFKYGCPPHGGFGLSPSRVLMLLLELKNVREATFLPRDTERLRP